ncbi:MAG TPA: hypothetical protein VMS00_12845, partial [Acidimicrobiales bacterium]|nr:hypothetical protein [Acidimicrobiales bacterium]
MAGDDELTDRARRWASTMNGHRSEVAGLRQAHAGRAFEVGAVQVLDREAREAQESDFMAPG